MIKQAGQWKILLCVSLLLLVFDGYLQRMQPVHTWINQTTLPFYQITDWPKQWLRGFTQAFSDKQQLQKQIQQLQWALNQAQVQQQQLQQLQQDKQQLQALLKLRQSLQSSVAAKVVNRVGYPQARYLFVDSIATLPSQAIALTGQGIVGLVVSQQNHLARIMPLSNVQSHIAIKAQHADIMAIAAGDGHGQLIVHNVARSKAIKVGQLWLSSGLDGLYPSGYAVGRVLAIKPGLSNQFVTLQLAPSVNSNHLSYVLIQTGESSDA